MPAENGAATCAKACGERVTFHEGSEIRTGLDRHAHECRFAQRVTQLLDEVSPAVLRQMGAAMTERPPVPAPGTLP